MVNDDIVNGSMTEVEISLLRADSGEIEHRMDFVAIEEPFHIQVNQEYYATFLCTPVDLKEFVIGNLVSEGLVDSLSEIEEVVIRRDRELNVTLRKNIDVLKRLSTSTSFRRLILSACGSAESWSFSKLIDGIDLPKITTKNLIKANLVVDAARQLNLLATNYRKTGGLHSAAIYQHGGELVSFSEDVGRHNAVDKAIGLALLKNCEFEKSLLVSSGRLSGDIVLKAARLRMPTVVSLSSALNSGIEVAKKTGVTLIGFVRGQRMNIYSYPERILIK